MRKQLCLSFLAAGQIAGLVFQPASMAVLPAVK
jgi:hypothetical protein